MRAFGVRPSGQPETQIAGVYQTIIPNINIHNILKKGERTEERTVKDYLIVQQKVSGK